MAWHLAHAAVRTRRVGLPVFLTRRLRGCIEFVLVALIWGVLVALAAGAYRIYLERAYVSEALSYAITIKEELMETHAQTGGWPAAIDTVQFKDVEQMPRHITIEYEEGAFTLTVGRENARYQVSFRAAVSESAPRVPVIWLCGYDTPPPGYHVIAKNRTDVPMLYLPNACQGHT